MALGALAAGGLWVLLWLSSAAGSTDDLVLALFVIASTAAFVATTSVRPDGGALAGADRWRMGLAGTITGLVLLHVLLVHASFDTGQWLFVAILCAALLWLAGRDEAYLPVAAAGAGLVAAVMLAWPTDALGGGPLRLLLTAGGFVLLFGVGGIAGLWRSPRPVLWAALAAGGPLVISIAAYGKARMAYLDAPWGLLSLALAALFVAATVWTAPRRERLADGNAVLAILAAAAAAFIAFAVPLELEREWLAVAWSLQAAALVWIAGRLGVPRLRMLAVPLAVLVGVRLLVNPAILDYDIGRWPVLNWLGYGYGVPIAGLAYAAWRARRDADGQLADGLEVLATVLGAAWIALEIHHAFHPRGLADLDVTLLEWGCLIVGWLLLALALEAVGRREPDTTMRRSAMAVALAATAVAMFGPVLLANPWFTDEPIRGLPLVNPLLVAYALPAVLAILLASRLRRDGARPEMAVWLEAVAIVLGALWASLEVHRAFHPTDGAADAISLLEWGCLHMAWLVFALALEAAGRRAPRAAFARGARAMAIAATLGVVMGPLLSANPMLVHVYVGGPPVINTLFVAYGIAGLLTLALAYRLRGGTRAGSQWWFGLGAFGLLLLLTNVTLEVRHAFQGPYLDGNVASATERYAYSLAWVLFATALLVVGIAWHGRLARYASLAVMLLAVGKVFLVDMADLTGLYRVFSFLGLGISLLLLSYLYQRFVFGQAERAGVSAEGPA